jgi:FkbM family methyltransferase
MPKTVFTHAQSRNFADLVNGKIVRHLERLATRFNGARRRKLAIFAHDGIGIQINQFGIYDKPDLDLLFRFLEPLAATLREGVALDIGANIGNHALVFADRFQAVHAFEPNPATFCLLAFNARLAANVVPHPFGLGDRAAVLQLNEDLDNMGASSIRYAPAANTRIVEIDVRRLDDAGLALEGLCFMKVDVEGFEAQVLRGGAHTIATHQPIIVMEQLEREFAAGEPESIALLRDMGFRFCWPRSAHKAKRGLPRHLDTVRNRLFGRPDLIELLSADEVPRGNHNLLIAVPRRFQAALGLA